MRKICLWALLVPFLGACPKGGDDDDGSGIMALAGSFAPTKYKVKEVIKGEGDRPDLTEAEIIVSGGRAMKESANFKILWELAEAIGPNATVGASRAAVDSGYAPHA